MSSQQLQPTLAGVHVQDVMRRGIIGCGPETDLATVARMMADNQVHAIVVSGIERYADGGEQLTWGIITALDLAAAALPALDAADAGALASTEVVTIEEAEPLERAAQLMAEHQLTHLLVVSRQARPIGIVSTLDVAACLGHG
jgi:CBS domain-containing protein